MSVIGNIVAPQEQRSAYSPLEDWLRDTLGGTPSTAGERVNARKALGLSAYWACVRNISEDIAKTPRKVRKSLGDKGNKDQDSHPVHELLTVSPNPEMTPFTFFETLTAHALGYHGGFAEILRDGSGRPAQLWPLDPEAVTVKRDAAGKIYYEVRAKMLDGSWHAVPLEQERVLHVHGMGHDGLTGYMLAETAKEDIGSALAAQKFNAAFFGNGTTTTGMIKIPNTMKPETRESFRDQFAERHAGAKNAFKPIILQQGADWVQTSTDPEKAQLKDILDFHIETIARLFRVPQHKIGHWVRAQGWSTLEATNRDYLQDCLLSWFVCWEQELKRKLFRPTEKKLYVQHNVKAFLRADIQAQGEFYTKMWDRGVFSTNDIRELEDMNPVPGGDKRFVPANMTPLETAGEEPEPEPIPPQLPEPEPPIPPEDDNRAITGINAAFSQLLTAAVARLRRLEHDKMTRASKHGGFGAAVRGFYEQHQAYAYDALLPPLITYAEALESIEIRDTDIEAYVPVFALKWAERHCWRARQALLDVAGAYTAGDSGFTDDVGHALDGLGTDDAIAAEVTEAMRDFRYGMKNEVSHE